MHSHTHHYVTGATKWVGLDGNGGLGGVSPNSLISSLTRHRRLTLASKHHQANLWLFLQQTRVKTEIRVGRRWLLDTRYQLLPKDGIIDIFEHWPIGVGPFTTILLHSDDSYSWLLARLVHVWGLRDKPGLGRRFACTIYLPRSGLANH